jgi:hypothetical protein
MSEEKITSIDISFGDLFWLCLKGVLASLSVSIVLAVPVWIIASAIY